MAGRASLFLAVTAAVVIVVEAVREVENELQPRSSVWHWSPGWVEDTFVKDTAIPVAALIIGCLLMRTHTRLVGLGFVYFGAQTGFSIYMKLILSDVEVDAAQGLRGVPAALLVTSVQMGVAFSVLLFGTILPESWRFRPKPLHTGKEAAAMMLYAVSFGMNIGLNNFSLAYLPVSLNVVIRSCQPLTTLAAQSIVDLVKGGDPNNFRKRLWELPFMVVGVLCAIMATVAVQESKAHPPQLAFGVGLCCLSTVFGSVNMIVAGLLGTDLAIDGVDALFYMSAPACVMLVVPGLLWPHAVTSWSGADFMTDREVFAVVAGVNKGLFAFVALSGIFAAAFNLMLYRLVYELSAVHTALAGNFNKACLVFLSMGLGLEARPTGSKGVMMALAVCGNITAFLFYSVQKASWKDV